MQKVCPAINGLWKDRRVCVVVVEWYTNPLKVEEIFELDEKDYSKKKGVSQL